MNWSSSVETVGVPLWFIYGCFRGLFLISLSVSGFEICFLFRSATSWSPFEFAFLSPTCYNFKTLMGTFHLEFKRSRCIPRLARLLQHLPIHVVPHSGLLQEQRAKQNVYREKKPKTISLCGVIQELRGSNRTPKQQCCRSVFSRDITIGLPAAPLRT